LIDGQQQCLEASWVPAPDQVRGRLWSRSRASLASGAGMTSFMRGALQFDPIDPMEARIYLR
jgi:hypothetical protein